MRKYQSILFVNLLLIKIL